MGCSEASCAYGRLHQGQLPCGQSRFTLPQTLPRACLRACPRTQVKTETAELDNSLIFEQDPVQIVDALLPLYMNSCLLRSLQEALASELSARMNAMSNASGERAQHGAQREGSSAPVPPRLAA